MFEGGAEKPIAGLVGKAVLVEPMRVSISGLFPSVEKAIDTLIILHTSGLEGICTALINFAISLSDTVKCVYEALEYSMRVSKSKPIQIVRKIETGILKTNYFEQSYWSSPFEITSQGVQSNQLSISQFSVSKLD